MKKLILTIFLTNFLVACASNQPKEEVAAPASGVGSTPKSQSAAQTQVTTSNNAQAVANSNGQVSGYSSAQPSISSSAQASADFNTQPSANSNAKAQADAELAALKSKNSVYFPFDVDAIQPADRETILNHARYLATHPSVKVRVEGHADERGSSEYNLALGQRRAENTKRALVQSGAAATQIETISYGEEKPRALGHDEASWAQNRRADINYDAR